MKEQIITGKWTKERLDNLLKEASKISDPGMRIGFLSGQFLGTPYRESTLTGDADTPEVFIINLQGVDCFTFIEHIEAMRISGSFAAYRDNLRKVRYCSGNIAFENRNHFFTDWREYNTGLVEDATGCIGGDKISRAHKTLNRKEDGAYLLPGIPCREREIVYIPSTAVDRDVIERLNTGDYVGIYTERPGLDVSHVGIVIRDSGSVFLRHASSSEDNEKVIDEDFINYIRNKPGIVVLRPVAVSSA